MSSDTFVVPEVRTLNGVDYGIMAASLLGCLTLGMYITWRQSAVNSDEMLVAKGMRLWPVIVSGCASFVGSSSQLLGLTAEVYQYGTVSFFAGIIASFISMPLAAILFVPVFYRLKCVSSTEYLEKRFNTYVRLFATIMIVTSHAFFIGLALYAPSLAIREMTGLNMWYIIFVLATISTLYTSLGGIKAVIWTDTFQMLIVMSVICTIVIRSFAGGFDLIKTWQEETEKGRVKIFDFNPDPFERHTTMTVVLTTTIQIATAVGTSQAFLQKIINLPTLRSAQTAVFGSLVANKLGQGLLLVLAMMVVSYYRTCDPIITKRAETAEQSVPLYIMDTLGQTVGLSGLYVSALCAGTLSQVAMFVSSTMAIIMEDIVKKYFWKDINAQQSIKMTRIIGAVYGFASIATVFLIINMGNILQCTLGLFTVFSSSLNGLYLVGMLFPSANGTGALVGTVSSFLVGCVLTVGNMLVYQPFHEKLHVSVRECSAFYQNVTGHTYWNDTLLNELSYDDLHHNESIPVPFRISYLYYGLIILLLCILISLVVSYLTGGRGAASDNVDLFAPFVRYYLLKKSHGQDYDKKPISGVTTVLGHVTISDGKMSTVRNDSIISLDGNTNHHHSYQTVKLQSNVLPNVVMRK